MTVFSLPKRHLSRAIATAASTAIAAALPFLGAGHAQAVVITVGGTLYDVMVSTMDFSGNQASFAPLPAPGQMPWWNNDMLASEFAEKVAGALGEGPLTGYGPVFAYDVDTLSHPNQVTGLLADTLTPIAQIDVFYAKTEVKPYAIATEAVPGPLPIAGVTAAFAWSRQLKRRLNYCNRSTQFHSTTSTSPW